jgi:hypothetical protein
LTGIMFPTNSGIQRIKSMHVLRCGSVWERTASMLPPRSPGRGV